MTSVVPQMQQMGILFVFVFFTGNTINAWFFMRDVEKIDA
jgi:hypothetical protein